MAEQKDSSRDTPVNIIKSYIAANADELFPKERRGDKIVSDYMRRAAELDRRAKERAGKTEQNKPTNM